MPKSLMAREVNSSDRFHHGFRFISPTHEPLSEKCQTSFFRGKSPPSIAFGWSDKHRTSSELIATKGLNHCVTSETWKNRKWNEGWDKNAITVRSNFVSNKIIPTNFTEFDKIYLWFSILDTCIKFIVCSHVWNQTFHIIFDTHFSESWLSGKSRKSKWFAFQPRKLQKIPLFQVHS